jgi:hypothetical protein
VQRLDQVIIDLQQRLATSKYNEAVLSGLSPLVLYRTDKLSS